MRPALTVLPFFLLALACRKTDAPLPDLDGDGYPVVEDCDDEDASVHPDADELCNDVDDDCDAMVDEDPVDAPTWYADGDGDGYGDPDRAMSSCEQPDEHVAEGTDCDDTDPAFHPGAVEDDCTDPSDYNCDGSVGYADADGDGFPACQDCDDTERAVNPAATEVCNSVDDDCDGGVDVDAVDADTWYADVDGDGYGDPLVATVACSALAGTVADATDCDDTDASVWPGAPEHCDAVDDDCDGDVDEDAVDAGTWYVDADGDGFGSVAYAQQACTQPLGWVADDGDCDDGWSAASPVGTEVCDGHDDDCDGTVDDGAADAEIFYGDGDGDGWGDSTISVLACEAPAGHVRVDGDCDDATAAVSPDAVETCNGGDDDCDGLTDESDADGAPTWYVDADGDGYGNADYPRAACDAPSGYVADATDCDDGWAAANPDGTEVCDGHDDDCDGTVDRDAADATTWYADADGDGWGDADAATEACAAPPGHVAYSGDCDDTTGAVSPDATEVCNGDDDDCDGETDEDDAEGAPTWYADTDGDGAGDLGASASACTAPAGYVASSDDCDDTTSAVGPTAPEVCDTLDNDCDGRTDEADATDASTWYLDYDGDGYGDDDHDAVACLAPSALYVLTGGDCDDTDPDVWPLAPRACGGVDHDCDGVVDYDGDGDGYQDASVCPESGDCDDTDPAVVPDANLLCPLGASCLDLLTAGYDVDGLYAIDPDGVRTGRDTFEVWCDQQTDGGGWTLVWKHAYLEVGATEAMRTFSSTQRDCLDTSDGDWCNVPDKLDLGTVEQRVTATHHGTVVYDFVGDLNADLDNDWSGGILDNPVELVDLCTSSTSAIPEPEHGGHAIPGLSWDKANNLKYTGNCDTDRYAQATSVDCRWENCRLPSSISSTAYHTQMTMLLWVR